MVIQVIGGGGLVVYRYTFVNFTVMHVTVFFLVVFCTIGSLCPRPKTNPSVDEVWGRDYTIGCSGI